MLREAVQKKFGDFSDCPELNVNNWRKIVLSGNIYQMMLALTLGRINSDVQSILAMRYRVVKKCKF